jgi:hypothetical protein
MKQSINREEYEHLVDTLEKELKFTPRSELQDAITLVLHEVNIKVELDA